jgi:hypothetical protein
LLSLYKANLKDMNGLNYRILFSVIRGWNRRAHAFSLMVMFKKAILLALLLLIFPSVAYGQDTLLAEGKLQVPNDIGLHNANLACQYINGTIVEPGQEFSFNMVVGERTPERGFINGDIITYRNGRYTMIQGLGGGICRTSTALHQTVLKVEGLEVIERHNHAAPVCYAELGMDAAIYQNVKNYRFLNSRENPIKIEMFTDGDIIHTAIYEILPEEDLVSTEIPLQRKGERVKVVGFLKNEVVYIALKDLAELLQADVKWYEETKTASLGDGKRRLLFKNDHVIALINEKPVELRRSAKIINDRMMLPLETIAQLFGLETRRCHEDN